MKYLGKCQTAAHMEIAQQVENEVSEANTKELHQIHTSQQNSIFQFSPHQQRIIASLFDSPIDQKGNAISQNDNEKSQHVILTESISCRLSGMPDFAMDIVDYICKMQRLEAQHVELKETFEKVVSDKSNQIMELDRKLKQVLHLLKCSELEKLEAQACMLELQARLGEAPTVGNLDHLEDGEDEAMSTNMEDPHKDNRRRHQRDLKEAEAAPENDRAAKVKRKLFGDDD